MSRQADAWKGPAVIFLGIALHDLASAGMFMLSRRESWRTPIFMLAFVCWVLCCVQTSLQIILIDFLVSQYAWLANKFPYLTIAAFTVNFFTGTLVVSLMISRLRVFHSGASPTFWSLFILALISIGFNLPANITGIMMNLEVIDGKIPVFQMSKMNGLNTFLFSIAHIAEGIFSALASIAFLWAIGTSLGLSKQDLLKQILVKHEGIRFIAIFGLNVILAAFALHAYLWDFNYVTQSAYYLAPWIYALEIHSFLLTSYVSARNMIKDYAANQSTEKTGAASEMDSKPRIQQQQQQQQQQQSTFSNNVSNNSYGQQQRSNVGQYQSQPYQQQYDAYQSKPQYQVSYEQQMQQMQMQQQQQNNQAFSAAPARSYQPYQPQPQSPNPSQMSAEDRRMQLNSQLEEARKGSVNYF